MSATAEHGHHRVSVGNEVGDEMGYFIRRIKRVEELLAIPEVMALIQQAVDRMDNYCRAEQVDPGELEVTMLPTPSLDRVPLVFGSRPCSACNGTGRGSASWYCPSCRGSGIR